MNYTYEGTTVFITCDHLTESNRFTTPLPFLKFFTHCVRKDLCLFLGCPPIQQVDNDHSTCSQCSA